MEFKVSELNVNTSHGTFVGLVVNKLIICHDRNEEKRTVFFYLFIYTIMIMCEISLTHVNGRCSVGLKLVFKSTLNFYHKALKCLSSYYAQYCIEEMSVHANFTLLKSCIRCTKNCLTQKIVRPAGNSDIDLQDYYKV